MDGVADQGVEVTPRPPRMGRGTTWRSGLVMLGLLALTACGSSEQIAEQTFTPVTPGRLKVATSLPAPGFWAGDRVDDVTGGYEWAIAHELAERFDLELELIDEPFDRLIAGDLNGADLALAQITVTDEREEDVSFSVPYYRDDAGAVLRAGKELTDLETAREQRWTVQPGTIEEDLLDDQVRPDTDPTPCADVVDCVDAVATGRADAALVDLSTALVLTNGRPDVTTGAKFVVDRGMAAALPKVSDRASNGAGDRVSDRAGESNVEVVDAALRALESDGTLDDLAHRYLAPVFEVEPGSLPVVRTGS